MVRKAFATAVVAVGVVFTVASAGAATYTFNAHDDSYVTASQPTKNFGGQHELWAGSSPDTRSYIKFDVSGVAGKVRSATLRLYAKAASPVGYDIQGDGNADFGQGGITYANAPAVTGIVASSGPISAAGYTSVDVTSLIVPGAKNLSLAVTSTSASILKFGSKEEGSQQPKLDIVSDNTAPTITMTAPADLARTSDTTPHVAGVAGTAFGDSANVTVKVYSGNDPSGTPVRTMTTTAAADGSYAVDAAPGMAPGTYTAQAEQVDDGGNLGKSSAPTFTIDLTPPVVTLTSPANGSSTSNLTPTFSGVAGHATGDSTVVRIDVYAGTTATGTPVQTVTGGRAGDGKYSIIATAPLARGTYTAQTTQVDDVGNVGLSSANTFTVTPSDVTAPVISLTAPANGATVTTGTPTFSGVAGTASGDSTTVTVKVYSGSSASGTPVETLTTTRSGSAYSVAASPALAGGTYTAQAEQGDVAGNLGKSSANTFTVVGSDTTPPAITLTAPANGATVTTGTPSFSGVAGTASGDSTTVTVKVYSGSSTSGLLVETLTTSRSGSAYSVAASPALSNGTYTAQAEQGDTAGNLGKSSANTFTVAVPDTTPPAITLTAPANGATVTTGTPSFSGVAGTASGDSTTVTVKVYSGSSTSGSLLETLTTSRDGSGAYSVAASPALSNGTYTAQAEQSDTAGNLGQSSANTFTVAIPDTTPPAITLTAPANGATVTTGTPSFSGVAGTASGDSTTVTVKVYAGTSVAGSLLQTLTTSRDGTGAYSAAATPALANGTYTAQAEQGDTAGNLGKSSANTFTVAVADTTPPAITLTAPANGATVTTGTPSFSGVAGTASGDSTTVTVKVYSGSSTSGLLVETLTTSRSGSAYSVAASPALSNGTYTAQAEQGDTAGNLGKSSANTFTVAVPDTTPPAITLTAPANGATVTTGTPSFSGVAGTASGDSTTVTVKVYSGSSTSGSLLETLTTSRDGSGTYSVAASPALSNGTYTAQAEQGDTAGNLGQSSANTFTVAIPDTTPPAITLTAPANGATVTTGTPSFSGVAGTASGDSTTVTVKVYAGTSVAGSLLQTLTTSRDGTGAYSAAANPPLADGTYTAQAEQGDTGGNLGKSSANTFTVATTSYRSAVMATSPIGYWRLGETSGTVAADETTADPGAYQNGVQLGVPGAIPGDSNPAAHFDGTDDKVSMGDPASGALDFGTGDFTLEAWIRTSVNSEEAVVSKVSSSGLGWQLTVTDDSGFMGSVRARISDGTTMTYAYGPSGFRVDDGRWHMVDVVVERGRDVIVYVDGISSRTVGAATGDVSNSWPFLVGGASGYPAFNGDVDEVSAYRSALSAGQIGSHWFAANPRPATSNPVQAENVELGSTTWSQADASAGSIEGYTSQISSAPGETVQFHVSTNPAARYRIEIYRLGWYRGAGARLLACLPSCATDAQGVAQPVPAPDSVTGELRAGWPVTDSIAVPSDWVSGYYTARLVLLSGSQVGKAGTVNFTVRAPTTRHSAILVQAAVNTWQAYNNWGGKDLYSTQSTNGVAAVKVSFDRPNIGQNPLQWEYQVVRFLEREGYDAAYSTDVDTQRDPAGLLDHKLLISAGHDEYWTKQMRDAWEAARDAGVNLAFLGGNDVYWQARYENSERTLVAYKSATDDPEPDPSLKTVKFRDLTPPRPECTLVGVMGQGGLRVAGDPPRDYAVNPDALGAPWFASTGFNSTSVLTDLVGYEWDAVPPGCAVPPLTVYFHYTGSPSNADAVSYTAPSGARVFAAGSMQFSWALDDYAGHVAPADSRLQQFMRNMFNDMTH